MRRSASAAFMPEVPEELFMEAIHKVVSKNVDYVPPAETGGSLYLRPLIFGSGAMIGMGMAPEYTFLVFGTPVGSYYKSGVKAVDAYVVDDYDRSKFYIQSLDILTHGCHSRTFGYGLVQAWWQLRSYFWSHEEGCREGFRYHSSLGCQDSHLH